MKHNSTRFTPMPGSRSTRLIFLVVGVASLFFHLGLRVTVCPLVSHCSQRFLFYTEALRCCGSPQPCSNGRLPFVFILPHGWIWRRRWRGENKPCALGILQPSGHCIPPPPQPQGSCVFGPRLRGERDAAGASSRGPLALPCPRSCVPWQRRQPTTWQARGGGRTPPLPSAG